jgi:hypothetical protein
VGSIARKKQRAKISCYCPFNPSTRPLSMSFPVHVLYLSTSVFVSVFVFMSWGWVNLCPFPPCPKKTKKIIDSAVPLGRLSFDLAVSSP